MVKLGGRAALGVVDSRLVKLEAGERGIHGNGDGANVGRRVLEIGNGAGGDADVSGDVGTNVGRAELALAINSLVGVRGLSVDSVVLDDVLEGLGHQTTVASLVALSSAAVNEVLLGERHKVASGKRVLSLSRSSGGESPA